MNTPMMTGMSAPNPVLPLNGHHQSAPTMTPAARSGPAPTGLPGPNQARSEQARAERYRLMRTRGKVVRWMLRVGYGAAAIVAGVGQFTGLGNKLPNLEWFLLPIPMVATEGFAILFATIAAYRRMLGENAYVAYLLAIVFSGFAIVVNYWGHHDTDVFLAWFYSAFSAAGFVVFMIETAFARRDALWLQNKIDEPPPLYGPWLEFTQPRLVARAKQLAVADLGLGRAGSLEAARQSLAADARRAAMQRIVRADLGRVLGNENADLMVAVIDPDQLADEIQERAQLGRLAEIYARRIDPQQIEEAHARERADRRKGRFGRGGKGAAVAQPVTPTPAVPVDQVEARPAPARSRASKVVVDVVSKRSNAEWAAEFRSQLAQHPTKTMDDSAWLADRTGLSTSRVRAVKRWMRDQEGGA